jgi:two-component system NarL family sensor kinase
VDGDDQHLGFLLPDQDLATLNQLLAIHDYERQRMGQELHDSTGQLIVVLLLSLARLKAAKHDRALGSVIDEIQDIVRKIDKEIRSLAFLHFPAELSEGNLPVSLKNLALGFGRRTGMRISFNSSGGTPQVDATISMALLRVTQEALVNVHRHSHATAAKVELNNGATEVELRIRDNGVGLPESGVVSATSGIGLMGMRNRIETHGGRFEVSNVHPGTMVRAVIPTSA